MKTKKSGKPVIPKAVWEALCSAYKKAASDLGAASKRALEPNTTTADIALQLMQKSNEYLELALASALSAKETRRGRPSTRPRSVNALAGLSKPGPGRPATRGKRFDRATYRIVEERRKALAADRKKTTITAAITSLVEELAAKAGRNRADAMKDEFNRLRASYQSGKKLSSS